MEISWNYTTFMHYDTIDHSSFCPVFNLIFFNFFFQKSLIIAVKSHMGYLLQENRQNSFFFFFFPTTQ